LPRIPTHVPHAEVSILVPPGEWNMVTTLFLLGCVLTTAQPAPVPPTARPQMPLSTAPREAGTSGQLTPKLVNAQELVYRGSFSEQAFGSVQFSRSYRLEMRV